MKQNKGVELGDIKVGFTQDNDGCDGNDLGQDIEIEVCDGGGGMYFVIKTKRWAVDDPSHLYELMQRVKDMVGKDWKKD